MSIKGKEAGEKKGSFVKKVVFSLSSEAIFALAVAPKSIVQEVEREFKKRVSMGDCKPEEISGLLRLAESMRPSIKLRHVEKIFKLLSDTHYEFALSDLKIFLVALRGKGQVNIVVSKLFVEHEDFHGDELLEVFKSLPIKDRNAFRIGFSKYPEISNLLSDNMKK